MRQIITLCLFVVAAAAPAITPQYEYNETQLCHDRDHAAVPGETGHTTSVKNEQTGGQSGDVQTSENEAIVNNGSYSVVGPDGVIYTVTYNTDSKDKPSQPAIEIKKEPPSEPTTGSVLDLDQSEEVHNKTSENEAIVNHGSYSVVGPDGVIYTVTYNTDKSVDNPNQPATETVKEPPSVAHLLTLTTVSVLENQTRQQDHFYPGSPGSPGTPGSPGSPGAPGFPGAPGLPYYSDAVLEGLVG